MNILIREEELLEPIVRFVRFNQGLRFIDHSDSIVLVDLGCGPKLRFHKICKSKNINIKQYIGIDPLINSKIVNSFIHNKQIRLIRNPLTKKIPLEKDSADYIVGFAFLEHVDNPEQLLNDSLRALKVGGKVIFTTPTMRAKTILEFLSFKLNLISKREILEHKNYFDKIKLLKLISKKYKTKVIHQYFEFGLNNLLVIQKIK